MGACGSTAASSSTSDPGVAPAPAATGEPPVKTPANYEAVPSANAAPLLPAETSVAPAADTTTKTVAADEVAVAEAPLPADASPEEISGKALLNTVLSTMLPSVRLAISDQLAKMYENSQFMPHEKGLSVEPVLNPSKPLVAGEMLDDIKVHFEHLHVERHVARSLEEEFRKIALGDMGRGEVEAADGGLTDEERAAIKVQTMARGMQTRKAMSDPQIRKDISELKKAAAAAKTEMGTGAMYQGVDWEDSIVTGAEPQGGQSSEPSLKRMNSLELMESAELALGSSRNVQELTASVDVALRLEFSEAQPIRFKIKTDKWYLKEITIRVLWVEVRAPAKLVFDLYHDKLKVGFTEPPTMRWDIELQLGWIQLPDFFEDHLPSWIIESVLGKYTPDNPLVMAFSPRNLINKILTNRARNKRNAKLVKALEEGSAAEFLGERSTSAPGEKPSAGEGLLEESVVSIENGFLRTRLEELKNELATARLGMEHAYERGVAKGYDLGHKAGSATMKAA